MNSILKALSGVLLLSSASAGFARPGDGDRALAAELRGRVAGPPVRCIDYHPGMSSRIIEGVGILYEGAGGTLYLNRPTGRLRALTSWSVPVTEIRGGTLCQREIIKMIDSSTHSLTGMVSLGAFVPYRLVR